MRYWPFLTGRVRRTGHREVAVPDLLDPAEAHDLLGRLPAPGGGFPTAGDEVLRRVVRRSSAGPLTVFYRVIEATAEGWGVAGDQVLHDQHGRPILMTEGIVVPGIHPDVSHHEIAAALRQAHALVLPAFQDFWAMDKDFTAALVPAQEFSTPDTDDQVDIEIVDIPQPSFSASGPAAGPVRPRVLRRLLVALFVASVGLVAGVVGWTWWPHACGDTSSGIHLNDEQNRECIGVTDGSDLFNDPDGPWNDKDRGTIAEINDVQRKIESANNATTETDRYVKVVLLMPLTVSQATPSAISLEQILHSLQGSYTALVRANEPADPSAVRLQLLLANQGSQQEAGAEFMDGITKRSEPDHPIVAVVGMGSSVPSTKTAAEYLAAQRIPMVTAVASADDLTNIPLLWSVSPSNLQYARALGSYLDHQSLLTSGVIVYDENSDLYTRSLAEAYRTELGRYRRFPDQPFRGSAMVAPAAPNVFAPVVSNLCNAANDPDDPLDMVFYAGRVVDFGALAEAFKGAAARNCMHRPLAILTVDTTAPELRDYLPLLQSANVTVIYATSSDYMTWRNNGAGTPPDYAAFLQAFRAGGFDEKNLADGYAIAHHDALLTAAQAIQLATQDRPGRIPARQDVISGFGHLSSAHAVPGASGELSFPPEGGRATGRSLRIQQLS